MSRQQEQSSTLDPKTAGLPNVDTDAEHDHDTARKASNASLKREGASRGGGGTSATAPPKQAANAPTKEAAHETSSTESAEAAAAAIVVLAKHMHDSAAELDAEQKAPLRGSFEPNRQAIFRIYSRVYMEAIRTNTLVRAARLDKTNAKTLIIPLEQLDGALFVFATKATLASQWAESHRDKGDDSKAPIVMNPADIKAQVADMHTPTGITFDEMNQQAISTPPAGEAKAVENAAFVEHLEAAIAAATSASLGNGDATRITQHVDAMTRLAPAKPHSLKAHAAALKGLTSALQALETAKPEMKEKLADAHGQLSSLLKLAK